MASIKCDVEECPYRMELGECSQEHNSEIYVNYYNKRYVSNLHCSFGYSENKKERLKEAEKIIEEEGLE